LGRNRYSVENTQYVRTNDTFCYLGNHGLINHGLIALTP
jgi:hypothetical protein